MPSFSSSIKGVKKRKNHPQARGAKIEIRRRVLDAIGKKAVIFDAFAGRGMMFSAVWHEAAGYVGCDLEWTRDDRLAYAADNRRVLRAIDLQGFTIFDLDAFGSPWEQALIIADRRKLEPGERIGFCLTDGSGLKIKQGGMPKTLAKIAGIRGVPAGGARWQDDLIDRAVAGLASRMGADVERRWQAKGVTGAAVRYIGLILNGAAAHAADCDSRSEDTVADRA